LARPILERQNSVPRTQFEGNEIRQAATLVFGAFLLRLSRCGQLLGFALSVPLGPVPFAQNAEESCHILNNLTPVFAAQRPIGVLLPKGNGVFDQITAFIARRAFHANVMKRRGVPDGRVHDAADVISSICADLCHAAPFEQH
jgi:hypothetical protein